MDRSLEQDTADFWWYARKWRREGDRLSYMALMEIKNRPDVSPSILNRIAEIERNETEASGPLRSASIA